MKIQSLGIIFILIVLPITLVIAEYSHTQFDTLVLENRFDSALVTATYDALKAFQLNTFNDPHSDIADRKISSIQASANAFYNSLQTGLSAVGYSMEDLYLHTPAIVYTMYDGYYIYSPYTNIADFREVEDEENPGNTKTEVYNNLSAGNDKIRYGFKPYIYYSCRYVVEPNSDFVITYSLDNYISIVGMINGKYVTDAGYLISPETLTKHPTEEKYNYNGIEIDKEEPLQEYIIYADQNGEIVSKTYSYIKINGMKYYLDETRGEIFYLEGGKRKQQVSSSNYPSLYSEYVAKINENKQAINYYKDAYEFTNRVLNIGEDRPYGTVLKDLRASDAIDKEGNAISLGTADYEIFADPSVTPSIQTPIEYQSSNFNEQRKAVIRYAIESNLSVSIANFNAYSSSSNDFQMPKLKETDWDLIENQVSIISFLQGINIGTKSYNGYAVVTNDKTEEVVKEEDIYIITTNDGLYHPDCKDHSGCLYHKVNDRHFAEDADIANNAVLGVLNTDFQVRRDINSQAYYYPKSQLGCYTSIVSQNNVNNKYDSIYEYLASGTMDSDNVKKLYYTALGRERWATYKVSSQVTKTIQDLK